MREGPIEPPSPVGLGLPPRGGRFEERTCSASAQGWGWLRHRHASNSPSRHLLDPARLWAAHLQEKDCGLDPGALDPGAVEWKLCAATV